MCSTAATLLRPIALALAVVAFALQARAQTPMDRPAGEVESALGRMVGCSDWPTWKNNDGCSPKLTGLATNVDRDPADGTVETIETGGVLEWGDKRIPNQGILARRALHKIFDYLFSQWPERSAWLDLALCNVMAGKRSTTKVGKLMILVEPELPADLPLIAAGIFVTKRPSVDQWMVRDTDVAPEGHCAPRMPPRL